MTICVVCQTNKADRHLQGHRVCSACHRQFYRLSSATPEQIDRATISALRILRVIQATKHGLDQFSPIPSDNRHLTPVDT